MAFSSPKHPPMTQMWTRPSTMSSPLPHSGSDNDNDNDDDEDDKYDNDDNAVSRFGHSMINSNFMLVSQRRQG